MTEAGTAVSIDTGTDELLCELRERVAILTLNRPEARNSLSDRLSPALRRMIADFAGDARVGALLVTGAGAAFCAGGDVKGMGRGPGAEMPFDEKVADLRRRQRTLTGALYAIGKPTVAALPGPAAGAGLSIALACDIRFMAESAFVTTAYAKIGLSGDYGMAWLLSRAVGSARARELMFTADKIDARRCEALGLANHVVPDAELADAAFAFARRLANGPAAALAMMKATLNEAADQSFEQSLDAEAERLVRSARTADHKEAVAAFVAKRAPVFGA